MIFNHLQKRLESWSRGSSSIQVKFWALKPFCEHSSHFIQFLFLLLQLLQTTILFNKNQYSKGFQFVTAILKPSLLLHFCYTLLQTVTLTVTLTVTRLKYYNSIIYILIVTVT